MHNNKKILSVLLFLTTPPSYARTYVRSSHSFTLVSEGECSSRPLAAVKSGTGLPGLDAEDCEAMAEIVSFLVNRLFKQEIVLHSHFTVTNLL